ncbi:MAG: hypothetical protein M3401_11040 [Actinomycetota bacterium]|nr:hypothetical protein [Actinomycetota bacterium]
MSTDYVGFCACGCIAAESCKACGTPLCEEHARTYPETPSGVSEYAAMQFASAVRLVGGVECESCRAERGRVALQEALNTPPAWLPDHWLDRAIALRTDQTRNEEEKRSDGEPPMHLTAADVVDEFLRRIDKEPHERAQVAEGSVFRKPEFVQGWKVPCLRNQYTQQYPDGSSARHPLPVIVTPEAELLGPPADANEQNLMAATWEPVYESEIDLALFVQGVANILLLSRFDP